MSYMIEFEIKALPRLPNTLLGSHWRTRSEHAKKWKLLVAHALHMNKPDAPLKQAKLTLIRRSTKRPDYDGIVGGMKVILDSLVYCGVLIDDTHEVIGVPTYDHEKVGPKCGGIFVRIEAIEPTTKETK
jgi:hypothetical protein